jgi:hypothetical protein
MRHSGAIAQALVAAPNGGHVHWDQSALRLRIVLGRDGGDPVTRSA